MCQALLEIMEPEIDRIVKSKVQNETQRNIISSVKSFRDLGAGNEKIKEILIENYKLTAKEAEMYLEEDF